MWHPLGVCSNLLAPAPRPLWVLYEALPSVAHRRGVEGGGVNSAPEAELNPLTRLANATYTSVFAFQPHRNAHPHKPAT